MAANKVTANKMFVKMGRPIAAVALVCAAALWAACGSEDAAEIKSVMPETGVSRAESAMPETDGSKAENVMPETDVSKSESVVPESGASRPGSDVASDSGAAYLRDFGMHPLYAEFLRGERKVTRFSPTLHLIMDSLGYFDDREFYMESAYDEEYHKMFAFADVNRDDVPELVFKMNSSPTEVIYLLGVVEDELVCFDVFETHTTHMAFSVCDNGIVGWGQNYDGNEEVYYTYGEDGSARELIHFRKEADTFSEPYSDDYDYYYENGDENTRQDIRDHEEYESLCAPYRGEDLEWYDCDDFADTPQWKAE
ncbi:MAG: hypothetical protein NC079_07545 [Clostridium sp.]|nr:hypothetical protein [Acetatifactor muris]MCM1527134.1 hypothetical protein [Bacteroides sp.]MCM1563449.1 hypothetical protein [Clostridium sp.]